MSTEDLIDVVCKKCRYYQTRCFFDHGDSLTKLPCEALKRLAEQRLRELKAKGKTEL